MFLTDMELQRYTRQIMLPEIGVEGQEKLKNASVLCVGAGGLGSSVLMYLAAAGVGILGMIDDDVVDESNLQRQILHGESRLGQAKVKSAEARLRELNSSVTLEIYHTLFARRNADEMIAPYNIIVDASDNFETRFLINRTCVRGDKPMVYGAVAGFSGQAAVFAPRVRGGCYQCLFSEKTEISLQSEPLPGVLGAVPGAIGSIQAAEVIKLILGVGEPLIGRLLSLDLLKGTATTVRLKKDAKCPVCGRIWPDDQD